MRHREGRLKAEYREWYPQIEAGVWHNAAWLAEVVRRQRAQAPSWNLETRVPCDEHFEFRGGAWSARSRRARAFRRGD